MRRRRMLTAQRKRGREVAAPKRKSDADQVIIVKKSDPGAPMTYRLVRRLRQQVDPDPAEMAERYGVEMAVPDWHAACVLRVRVSAR
jgi:hypothetical protein